jgi:hypothetical protein
MVLLLSQLEKNESHKLEPVLFYQKQNKSHSVLQSQINTIQGKIGTLHTVQTILFRWK